MNPTQPTGTETTAVTGGGTEPVTSAPAPSGETTGSNRLQLVLAVVALFLLATILTAVLLWRRSEDADDDRAALQAAADDAIAARSVAAEVGEALLTYDFDDLRDARERVLEHATEDFAEIYDQAFDVGLEPTISELQASSQGTVQDVYLTEIDDDEARAVVVVDAEAVSSAGTRRLIGSYLQMELVREDGAWLVDEVFAIAAVDETVDGPDTDASTTTTAPAGE